MTHTIQEMEDHIVKLDEVIKFGDAIQRLTANADYRRVIEQGFMTEDCARFVQLSVNTNFSEEQRLDALGSAQAAGHLKQYISAHTKMANTADAEKRQAQQAIEEMRTGDVEDDA